MTIRDEKDTPSGDHSVVGTPGINSSRILVVDDDAANRLKLTLSVKQLGFDSTAAENGRIALDLLAENTFDLVLLDILMPEMDGYQVLEAMRGDAVLRDIPVVVISSLDELDAIVRAIELGAQDYLPKTFDPILLKARVNACLERKRWRDLEVEYLRQVDRVTAAAAAIEAQDFDPEHLNLDQVTTRNDALGHLARVFIDMAREVHSREMQMKNELRSLRIEIDEARQEKQVSSITGTNYFKDLQSKAAGLRAVLDDNRPDSD